MDLNLKWEISKWLLRNIADIILWTWIARFISNSILMNVPAAKANSGYEAICNVINSLYEGAKNLVPGKTSPPAGSDPA